MLIVSLLLLATFLFVTFGISVTKTKVIVSGAAGRTGSIVLKKLLSSQQFDPLGKQTSFIDNNHLL